MGAVGSRLRRMGEVCRHGHHGPGHPRIWGTGGAMLGCHKVSPMISEETEDFLESPVLMISEETEVFMDL